jgi:hypothetical protein
MVPGRVHEYPLSPSQAQTLIYRFQCLGPGGVGEPAGPEGGPGLRDMISTNIFRPHFLPYVF